MERRYELRLEQMLAQAEVSPERMQNLFDRLDAFVEPFAASLDQPERRRHAAEYLSGLLSKLPRKSGEAIALAIFIDPRLQEMSLPMWL